MCEQATKSWVMAWERGYYSPIIMGGLIFLFKQFLMVGKEPHSQATWPGNEASIDIDGILLEITTIWNKTLLANLCMSVSSAHRHLLDRVPSQRV